MMVKRNEKNIVGEIEKLNEKEKIVLLDHISEILSARIYQSKEKTNSSDDLIGVLSDTYENRRARQVFEWEKARRGIENRQRAN